MIRISIATVIALSMSISTAHAETPTAPPAPAKAVVPTAPVVKTAPAAAAADPAAKAVPTAAASGLQGSWTLNKDKIKDMPEYKAAPEPQQKMMLSMLQQVNMDVSFTADSMTMAMEMGGQKKEESAQYVVKSSDGATTVITTSKDGLSEDITLTLSGDELTMAKGEKQKLFLTRKK